MFFSLDKISDHFFIVCCIYVITFIWLLPTIGQHSQIFSQPIWPLYAPMFSLRLKSDYWAGQNIMDKGSQSINEFCCFCCVNWNINLLENVLLPFISTMQLVYAWKQTFFCNIFWYFFILMDLRCIKKITIPIPQFQLPCFTVVDKHSGLNLSLDLWRVCWSISSSKHDSSQKRTGSNHQYHVTKWQKKNTEFICYTVDNNAFFAHNFDDKLAPFRLLDI